MDRFYRALRGITIAALALGLLSAGYVFYTNWPDMRVYSAPTTDLLHALNTLGYETLLTLGEMLGSSACVLGITLAWLDRRKRWFAALMIATLATHLFPAIVDTLVFVFPNQRIQILDYSSAPGAIYITSVFLAPLIALALTLLFTRTIQERVAVDANLGITRSAL